MRRYARVGTQVMKHLRIRTSRLNEKRSRFTLYRPLRLALCLILAVCLLTSCNYYAPGKQKVLRYDIPSAVTNLDPQYATDFYSRMIIANIYEGLMTRGADGSITQGVAERYETSSDGMTMTFYLREDASWSNGDPVLAEDFEFAFKRMFAKGASSPFARDYISIENVPEILDGKLDADKLGVTAKSDYELEIRLSHPSAYFPELLAETPAMPCNPAFFEESRGRYGLDIKFVGSNGPFYLDRWDNEASIYLRPNTLYQSPSPVMSGGVNLHVGNSDSLTRLQEGTADIVHTSFDEGEKLKTQGYSVTDFDNIVWCIVFNQSSDIWGNPLLRQGFSQTIDPVLLKEVLPAKLKVTDEFLPPTAMVAGQRYRESYDGGFVRFNPESGARLYEMVLSAISPETVSQAVSAVTFYVPDSADHLLAMGMVQQSWQKYLSAYVNIEAATPEQIQQRFTSGDYDVMLVPLSSPLPSADSMLSMFMTDSTDNRFGYHNPVYDNLLEATAAAENAEEAVAAYTRAESLLLQDAVVIPVYVEASSMVVSPDVKGLNPEPYPARLNFKFAEKK